MFTQSGLSPADATWTGPVQDGHLRLYREVRNQTKALTRSPLRLVSDIPERISHDDLNREVASVLSPKQRALRSSSFSSFGSGSLVLGSESPRQILSRPTTPRSSALSASQTLNSEAGACNLDTTIGSRMSLSVPISSGAAAAAATELEGLRLELYVTKQAMAALEQQLSQRASVLPPEQEQAASHAVALCRTAGSVAEELHRTSAALSSEQQLTASLRAAVAAAEARAAENERALAETEQRLAAERRRCTELASELAALKVMSNASVRSAEPGQAPLAGPPGSALRLLSERRSPHLEAGSPSPVSFTSGGGASTIAVEPKSPVISITSATDAVPTLASLSAGTHDDS